MPLADLAFFRALQDFYISYWPSKTIRYSCLFSVVSKYDQTTVIQSELVWIQFSIGIVKYCLRKGLRGWDTWNRSSTSPSHLSKVIITVSTHTSSSIFCLSTCKIFHTKDCEKTDQSDLNWERSCRLLCLISNYLVISAAEIILIRI